MKIRLLLLTASLLAFVAAPLRAAEAKFVYLSLASVDAKHLVPAPPAPGSPEDQLDLDSTVAVHHAAPPAAIARGQAQNTLSPFQYAPAIGPWFTAQKCPKTAALLKQVEAEAKLVTDDAKNFFKRPRPYHVAPEQFPNAIEHEDLTHYSYPSGHSTRGTTYAFILAELLPEKRDAILAQGRETGWLRVQGGVHYPLDIFAGRVLGQALARALLANAAFQRDLAPVREELSAAAKD